MTSGGCTEPPGVRAPLWICNNISSSNLAGQGAGLGIWIGNNPTATPGAGDTIAFYSYIDNLGGRSSIWAYNPICLQATVAAGGGGGINHCIEIDVNQSITATTPLSGFSQGPVSHGAEAVCSQNTSGSAKPCQTAFWVWAAGDYANNASSTTQPWNFAYAASRTQQAGFDCEINPAGASDSGTYFKQGCFWDQSNSNTSLLINGSHSYALDVSGATMSSGFANCGSNVCSFIGAGGVSIAATLNIGGIPTSAGGGGLYVCIDTSGNTYKKSACP